MAIVYLYILHFSFPVQSILICSTPNNFSSHEPPLAEGVHDFFSAPIFCAFHQH